MAPDLHLWQPPFSLLLDQWNRGDPPPPSWSWGDVEAIRDRPKWLSSPF